MTWLLVNGPVHCRTDRQQVTTRNPRLAPNPRRRSTNNPDRLRRSTQPTKTPDNNMAGRAGKVSRRSGGWAVGCGLQGAGAAELGCAACSAGFWCWVSCWPHPRITSLPPCTVIQMSIIATFSVDPSGYELQALIFTYILFLISRHQLYDHTSNPGEVKSNLVSSTPSNFPVLYLPNHPLPSISFLLLVVFH